MSADSLIVLKSIRDWLTTEGVQFREVHHGPTRTSEEAAAARGEALRVGGKALLLKANKEFRLFVLPANRKLDSNALREHLGAKKTRFASADELAEMTTLVPGSVPPFGRPILPFDLYLDATITENERIAFNAGSLTDSIIMSVDDYLTAARPSRVFSFTNPA